MCSPAISNKDIKRFSQPKCSKESVGLEDRSENKNIRSSGFACDNEYQKKCRKRTIVASSLDNLDALLDNDIAILGIGRRSHGWEQGQVDTEGLVSHGAAAANLVTEMLRSGLRQGSQDSETAGIGHGRSKLGGSDL